MPLPRAAPTTLAGCQYWPSAICVDDSHAYFATDIGLFMSDK